MLGTPELGPVSQVRPQESTGSFSLQNFADWQQPSVIPNSTLFFSMLLPPSTLLAAGGGWERRGHSAHGVYSQQQHLLFVGLE